MRRFSVKKVVDEREEMEMMKVEHVFFWVVFWGLLVSMFVQLYLGADFRQIGGEWCVFMIMAVGTVIGELKAGLFDYWSRPGWKSYLTYSVIAAVCVMGISSLRGILAGWYDHPADAVLSLSVLGLSTGVITYICLALAGTFTKYRRRKLEEAYEEEE